MLGVTEINADDRVAAAVMFDLDDIDAALEELDARYLAGEAAAHSHTWSVVAEAYAALNRHELYPTTPDWVNIDHRRATSVRAWRPHRIRPRHSWTQMPDISFRIEAVHRLSDLGTVYTQVLKGDLTTGLRRRVADRRTS